MATIFVQNEEKWVKVQEEVEAYLDTNEVIYENWDVTKLSDRLSGQFKLSDEDKQEILETFKVEIADISERRGYQAQDVISLASDTPNLDQLLANFQQEHHHTDDEVRFIVSGHGVFVIQAKDGGFFEVHLEPGDLISVPENVRHYFTLSEDRQVVAVRIFVTPEGWVPIYEAEEAVN